MANNLGEVKHQVAVEDVEPADENLKQDLAISTTTTTTTTTTKTTATTTSATSTAATTNCQQQQQQAERQQKQSFCAGCNQPIREKFIFSVIDLYWHQDCVKCADCAHNLTERCYTFEGKLYCKHDYWHRFGPKCYACKDSIDQSELVQKIKGNRIYHLKCFACHECHRQLEQGEQLHLINDKRLMCRQDFQKINHQNQQLHNGSKLAGQDSKNGFTEDRNNGTENSTTYFTLLSSSPPAPQPPPPLASLHDLKSSKSHKRSSLTSLDNMTLDEDIEAQNGLADPPNGMIEEVGETLDLAGDDFDDIESANEYSLSAGIERAENEENRLNGSFVPTSIDHQGADHQAGAKREQDPSNDNHHSSAPPNNSTKIKHAAQLKSATAASAGLGGQQTNASKRKRRRKQQQQQQCHNLVNDKQQCNNNNNNKDATTKAGSGKMLLSSRNGESILNGSASTQQTASILSGMQSPPSGVSLVNQDQLQISCSSSSSSSSSSEDHSTSSNSNSNSNSQHQTSNQRVAAGQQQQQHPQHQHHQQQNHHQLHHHHHHHHQSSQQHHHHHHHHQSGGGAGAGHKPTRVRTVLNEKQLQTLRDCYANNPRPDALMKEQLVDLTGLSSRVIRVWFQNKRCKDKKKSILYKQMQQHEKDGRHLASLTHIRGVQMVASSPIHYQEEHSSAANTPPTGNSNDPSSPQATQQQQQHSVASVQSPQLIQQQQAAASGTGNSGSNTSGSTGNSNNNSSSHQAIDIHAYQPHWKGLVDYAQQQQQQASACAASGQQPQLDRLSTASPRYQQLIGQIHGYGAPAEHQQVGQDMQQQQQQQYGIPGIQTARAPGVSEPSPAYPHSAGLIGQHSSMPTHHQQQQQHHLRQLATSQAGIMTAGAPPMTDGVGGGGGAGGHHMHQFQH